MAAILLPLHLWMVWDKEELLPHEAVMPRGLSHRLAKPKGTHGIAESQSARMKPAGIKA